MTHFLLFSDFCWSTIEHPPVELYINLLAIKHVVSILQSLDIIIALWMKPWIPLPPGLNFKI